MIFNQFSDKTAHECLYTMHKKRTPYWYIVKGDLANA